MCPLIVSPTPVSPYQLYIYIMPHFHCDSLAVRGIQPAGRMILPVLLLVGSVACQQPGSVVVRKTVASGVESREGSAPLASAAQLETRLAQMEATIRSLQRRLEVRGQDGPACVCNGSEVLDQIQEDILHNKEDIADLRQARLCHI